MYKRIIYQSMTFLTLKNRLGQSILKKLIFFRISEFSHLSQFSGISTLFLSFFILFNFFVPFCVSFSFISSYMNVFHHRKYNVDAILHDEFVARFEKGIKIKMNARQNPDFRFSWNNQATRNSLGKFCVTHSGVESIITTVFLVW